MDTKKPEKSKAKLQLHTIMSRGLAGEVRTSKLLNSGEPEIKEWENDLKAILALFKSAKEHAAAMLGIDPSTL